jgi:hypothetical protein
MQLNTNDETIDNIIDNMTYYITCMFKKFENSDLFMYYYNFHSVINAPVCQETTIVCQAMHEVISLKNNLYRT